MTALTIPTTSSVSRGTSTGGEATSLESLKNPDKTPPSFSPSLTNITFTAVADTSGRIADAFDTVVTLPKLVGDSIASLNIPGASWAASTVGSIFAGSLSVMAHGLSFGAAKWLQGIRRSTGVYNGINDAFSDTSEIPSITAQSYLSDVKDPVVRHDLMEYFNLHSNLQQINLNPALSDEDRSSKQGSLKRQLVHLELKLARRSELEEFKDLINADEDPSPAAHKKLEILADQMASKLISKVENSHKERLGILGSKMDGSWVSLAAKGESGREELRIKIKDRLITAYEAEQRSENGRAAMTEAKQALSEAFGAKAAFREAGFYFVLGALIHTGALSGFVSLVTEHSDKIGQALGAGASYLWSNFVPEAVRQTFEQGFLYAKLALGGVASLYVAKGASLAYGFGKGVYEMFGPHTSSSSTASHVDTSASPSDVKVLEPGRIDSTPHVDATNTRVDPLQAHLDALKTDAFAAPTAAHVPDAVSAVRPGADTAAPGAVLMDIGTLRTNAELRVAPDSIRADGIRVTPDIHVK